MTEPERMWLFGYVFGPPGTSRHWVREMTPEEVRLELSLREAGVERDFDYGETPA